ncbi:CKLF-like MARVEL transmembrane domain-containing protein 6 isoform X1 [Scleropages formosus]|uniref:CKLF-like MARVEL transmembrane domain-containing protein 6 isoform X1 n=1 Tax=Scleropages formosus TaxID=113540 RepID=UPI0010FAB9F1|nr:CKLF-like MARVEL transmembrane domain-containing protein 6 isoform X1 [Scleropages formosus]
MNTHFVFSLKLLYFIFITHTHVGFSRERALFAQRGILRMGGADVTGRLWGAYAFSGRWGTWRPHVASLSFLPSAQQLLSFVAFILEEVVSNCTSCTPLYVFEFFSCTAFLFTTLLLVLLATTLHQKVGITCWPTLDLCYTLAIGVLFLIASVVFSADNGGSQLEGAAVVFGFLASFAFLVDAGIFVKTSGLPCRSGPRPAPDGPQHRAPEVEKLNANGTE